MYTPLFYGVTTPSTFIAPVVEPLDVARKIVEVVERRQGGEIYAPWYVGYMYVSLTLFTSLSSVFYPFYPFLRHLLFCRSYPASLPFSFERRSVEMSC